VTVLLTTDGTYPAYPGGVSVWCDQLMRHLPDVGFHVFAISYSPSHAPIFERPANVISQQVLPLWGTEEPGPPETSISAALRRRARTSTDAIRSGFIEPFELCLRALLCPSSPPEAMAEALCAMHKYFGDYDYALTVSSPQTWDAFLQICCDFYPASNRLSLEEATTCIRWLRRYLAVVAVRYPQAAVVHASMAGLAGIPGVIQKRLYGSRFLLTEHGIFLRELYLSLSRMQQGVRCRRFLFGWYEAIARMNYRFADAVSSLCQFNRKWQIRVGADPKTLRIVPNGIDPSVFSPRPADAFTRAHPIVLTMARIHPLKGIDHLLRAARVVLDRLPDVRFRILGEVSDLNYHRKCVALAAELGITANIEWSKTSHPPSAYHDVDVFCLPSISEAMPYSVLEAMFSACPVVATDVGGVAEMLAGTGIVVPPRDVECMARAILSLLQGDAALANRRRLAERALARARSLYTVEKCSLGFQEIYAQLSDIPAIAPLSAAV
jgi:polysaccharide biosynthesis protein PelF